ncbi:MAG TPA: ATP-binding protein [Candidatus Cryosericum sp.]|nr:ATP-binding protein [Candidatus Cryosericum sp.]
MSHRRVPWHIGTSLVVGLLLLATSSWLLVASVHQAAVAGENARLEAAARLLSASSLQVLQSGASLPSLVRGELPAGMRLTVLNPDGSAAADSAFPVAAVVNRLKEPEVQQAIATGTGTGVTYHVEAGKQERSVCVSMRDSHGTLIGIAVASSDASLPWQAASGTVSWALPLLLGIGVCLLILSAILAGRERRPLEETAEALELRSLPSLAGLAMHAGATPEGRIEKAAYATLQENESLAKVEQSWSARLTAVLDALPLAAVLLDDTLNVTSSNPLFDLLVPGDLLPPARRHIAELLPMPDLLAAIDRCAATHQPQQLASALRGHSYACTVQELSQWDMHERRIIVLLEDVTDAAALARVKADFVANASHELKTPLTAIQGYLDLLREEPGNTRYLDIIGRNVARLIELSTDISVLSRFENQPPSIELVDLHELKRDTLELFEKRAAEAGVPLRFEIQEGAETLYADRLMLQQLLINLVENAYRFTEAGTITVTVTREGGFTVFRVADTGRGIAPTVLPRIFERFYSNAGRGVRPGTGLGLAIVKRIVLAHNGTIDVHSTVDKGTTFVIRIPENLRPPSPDGPPAAKEDS